MNPVIQASLDKLKQAEQTVATELHAAQIKLIPRINLYLHANVHPLLIGAGAGFLGGLAFSLFL